jgi:hypothetical protein
MFPRGVVKFAGTYFQLLFFAPGGFLDLTFSGAVVVAII